MSTFRHTTQRIAAVLCPDQKTKTPTPSPTPRPVIPFQRYLNRAYQTAKAAHELGPTDLGLRASIPISIFLRSKGPHHEYAGVLDEIGGLAVNLDIQEYFSGSLLKVAALFAAFKLRKEANLLIKDIRDHTETGVTPANFFTKLKPRLHLETMVDRIKTDPAFIQGRVRKEPLFPEILAVTGSFAAPLTLTTDFTPTFRGHLRDMIIPGNNCSAGECIFRLSYPFINVALMQDGYFDRLAMKGIWLCGDFIDPPPDCTNQDKSQAFIRIETINDCDEVAPTHFCGSAQNATSMHMSRLFLDMMTESLVDLDSSREMLGILRETQLGDESSFLTRPTVTIPRLFDVDAVKIGQGPLKPDPARDTQVRSEGLVVKWKNITPGVSGFDAALKKKFDDLNLKGEAAICYQNHGRTTSHNGIVKIINNSVLDYLNQAPLP